METTPISSPWEDTNIPEPISIDTPMCTWMQPFPVYQESIQGSVHRPVTASVVTTPIMTYTMSQPVMSPGISQPVISQMQDAGMPHMEETLTHGRIWVPMTNSTPITTTGQVYQRYGHGEGDMTDRKEMWRLVSEDQWEPETPLTSLSAGRLCSYGSVSTSPLPSFCSRRWHPHDGMRKSCHEYSIMPHCYCHWYNQILALKTNVRTVNFTLYNAFTSCLPRGDISRQIRFNTAIPVLT